MNQGAEKLIFSQRVRKELEKLNAWQKLRIRGGKKHYLYHEQRGGWTGKLPIYLFWCEHCQNYSLDYPHGFIQNQYLTCHRCRGGIGFTPWWVPWAELGDLIQLWWRYRKGIPEKEGEDEKGNAQKEG